MKLIDTHCHIDSTEFEADRDRVLKSAFENDVEKIIVPATTKNHWHRLVSICENNGSLYPALGLHPVYLGQHSTADLDELVQQLKITTAVAVGEIGLDFFIKDLDKAAQLELFDSQLSIARENRLPVILHCRKAYDEMIGLLGIHRPDGGIAHAFNGSVQQAHKLIDLGFKLGFGGMLTYPRSSKLRKLANDLPLSSIVLETDSPDLTVAQYQGQRNSPEYLPFVLQALAAVRSEPIEMLAYSTYKTSMKLFKLSRY